MIRNKWFLAYCIVMSFVGVSCAQQAGEPASARATSSATSANPASPCAPVIGPELSTHLIITEDALDPPCLPETEYESTFSPTVGVGAYPSQMLAVPSNAWKAPLEAWEPISDEGRAASAAVERNELIYKGSKLLPGQTYARKTYGPNGPYAVTPYYDSRGAAYRADVDNLPGAVDPNDFQASELLGTQSLGIAASFANPFLAAPPERAAYWAGTEARLGLQARPGVYYDTGFIESTNFFPPKIALDGSEQAHNRGQTFFTGFDELRTIPLRGQFDAQSLKFLNLGAAQIYLDAFTTTSRDWEARTVLARMADSSLSSFLAAGKAETVFGDDASIPILIQSGSLPIGAVSAQGNVDQDVVFTGLPQVRVSRYWNGTMYELTGSIEDQSVLGDLEPPADATFLHRYPVFVQRFRYRPTLDNSFQIAALIRPIVLDDPAFNDHTEVGWGVSAIGRWYNAAKTDGILAGAVTGEGIGGYIYGGSLAAIAPTPTSILLFDTTGAYVGYQHVWYKYDESHNLSSNIAYGFVHADAPRADDNHLLHQAWVNLLWNVTANTAFGFEYQFGSREVGDGRTGDDHRIMAVLQLQPSVKAKSLRARAEGRSSELPRLSDFRF